MLCTLVLLGLPACCFCPGSATLPLPNLNPGDAPYDTAVFCDIEQQQPGGTLPNMRRCATDSDISGGVPLAEAAIALNNGSTGMIGLDYSPAALAVCSGMPQAVVFYGVFPQGYASCVNANDVGSSGNYGTADALCVAQCEDFFATTDAQGNVIPNSPPDPATVAWCAAHAHASTNFPELPATPNPYTGACSAAGMFDTAFGDPRKLPEPIVWENLVGTSASGSTLTKTAGTANFDSGGVSTQTIDVADGYVEFTAPDNTTAKIVGLTTGPPGADTDASANALNFGVGLSFNGQVFVYENGNAIGPLGAYLAGDRFRVTVHDNFDGTATVSFSTVTGTCNPGSACNETVFSTGTMTGAYPFHVDASLYSPGTTITNVQIVRIE